MRERCQSDLGKCRKNGLHPRPTHLIPSWILPRPQQNRAIGSPGVEVVRSLKSGLSGYPRRGRWSQVHGKVGGMTSAHTHTTQSLTCPESAQTSMLKTSLLTPQQGMSFERWGERDSRGRAIAFPHAVVWREVLHPRKRASYGGVTGCRQGGPPTGLYHGVQNSVSRTD